MDSSIALSFDIECARVLHDFDVERDQQMLAAMGMSVAMNQLPPELQVKRGPRRIRQ